MLERSIGRPPATHRGHWRFPAARRLDRRHLARDRSRSHLGGGVGAGRGRGRPIFCGATAGCAVRRGRRMVWLRQGRRLLRPPLAAVLRGGRCDGRRLGSGPQHGTQSRHRLHVPRLAGHDERLAARAPWEHYLVGGLAPGCFRMWLLCSAPAARRDDAPSRRRRRTAGGRARRDDYSSFMDGGQRLQPCVACGMARSVVVCYVARVLPARGCHVPRAPDRSHGGPSGFTRPTPPFRHHSACDSRLQSGVCRGDARAARAARDPGNGDGGYGPRRFDAAQLDRRMRRGGGHPRVFAALEGRPRSMLEAVAHGAFRDQVLLRQVALVCRELGRPNARS
mmetsp:Transcript_73642/g.204725  ORF Transcript_73642/g.204725 Transcript_73642/m.204725 type:complete len:337 (+) Transcript_73642:353-1363(+)